MDDVNDEDKAYKPHDLLQRQNIHVQPSDTSAPARRAKRMKTEVNTPFVRGQLCCRFIITV